MPVTVFIRFSCVKDRGRELASIMQRSTDSGDFHPECTGAEVYQNTADPDEVILIEQWTSKKIHEELAIEAKRSGAMDGFKHLYTSYSISYFEALS